jgi:hypothetical protein
MKKLSFISVGYLYNKNLPSHCGGSYVKKGQKTIKGLITTLVVLTVQYKVTSHA